MKRYGTILVILALLWVLGVISFLPAAIIQAIVPAAVPTSFRQGQATGTSFLVCKGAFVNGNLISTDVNGNCIDSGAAGAGGGIISYASPGGETITVGTYFLPLGGGGVPSTTEADVKTLVETAGTVANFGVQISVALGMGNTGAFTIRDNGSNTAVTCTISGAAAVACNDTTHTFNTVAGHTYTVGLVTTGTITVTPIIQMTAQYGSVGTTVQQLHNIGFVIDGGGSAITTGDIKTYPTADFSCTINRIDISADQSGTITVDVWKAAGAIPTSGNKISASAPLTLSSAQLAQNGSLTGWTTTVSVGDVFGFNVATAMTVTRVVGQIWCQ